MHGIQVFDPYRLGVTGMGKIKTYTVFAIYFDIWRLMMRRGGLKTRCGLDKKKKGGFSYAHVNNQCVVFKGHCECPWLRSTLSTLHRAMKSRVQVNHKLSPYNKYYYKYCACSKKKPLSSAQLWLCSSRVNKANWDAHVTQTSTALPVWFVRTLFHFETKSKYLK